MRELRSLATEPLADRPTTGLALCVCLAVLLPLAAMAVPWIVGGGYTKDDLGAFHLPVRAFYADQLQRGEPFDWMPQLYSGLYLTGEGQAGGYHPLHLLLYRFLPLSAATACEYLASYPWMLAGMWLFLRRRLGRWEGAAMGAIAFTWCSFNLLHFIHPNAIAVVAHIPWLLWTIDIVTTDTDRRRAAWAQGGLALLVGSQLLLGYPQYVWFSFWTMAGYMLFLLVKSRRTTSGHGTGGAWARVAIAVGVGILLGSVQLLPTLDALRQSNRWGADGSLSALGAMHPWNLLQLVAPYLFEHRVVGQNTHELGLYVGAVPLLLAAWAITQGKNLGLRAPLMWASLTLAILALLAAFGPFGPLHCVMSLIPLAGSFRFSCRMIVIFELAVAVLAAIGFTALVEKQETAADVPRTARTPWTIAGLSLAIALTGLCFRSSGHIAGIAEALAGPALLCTAALLLTLALRGKAWAIRALVLFTAADLAWYGLSYSVYPPGRTIDEFAATAETPPGETDDRVVADFARPGAPGFRTGNAMTLAGWQRADGYAGLEPARRLDLGSLNALKIAGVRWVRRTPQSEAIAGLLPRGEHWLEVPDPLPHVRLAARIEPSDQSGRDVARIDPETTVLVDTVDAGPLAAAFSSPAAPGSIHLIDERPGQIAVELAAPAAQILTLAESWHSGWKAVVDGQRRDVLRVNGDFMGCLVGPGDRRVVFTFQPNSLWLGKMNLYLGLGLLPVCFVSTRGFRRFGPPLRGAS